MWREILFSKIHEFEGHSGSRNELHIDEIRS
jgi:hypothetical protein